MPPPCGPQTPDRAGACAGEHEDARVPSSNAADFAYTVPAAQGPAVRDGAGAALPELPDAAQLWQREGSLVKLWFAVSVVRRPKVLCAPPSCALTTLPQLFYNMPQKTLSRSRGPSGAALLLLAQRGARAPLPACCASLLARARGTAANVPLDAGDAHQQPVLAGAGLLGGAHGRGGRLADALHLLPPAR